MAEPSHEDEFTRDMAAMEDMATNIEEIIKRTDNKETLETVLERISK